MISLSARVVALTVLFAACGGVTTGRAAPVEPSGRRTEATSTRRLGSANKVRKVGMGLTISGLIIVAGGWLGMAIDPNYGMTIGGLVVGTGIGGPITLSGAVTWIVGSVRYSIEGAGSRWKTKRKAWILGGLLVTGSGGALAATGAILLAAHYANPNSDGPLGYVGLAMLGVGLLSSLVVGLPMWAAAHRWTAAQPVSQDDPLPRPGLLLASRPLVDAAHEARWAHRWRAGAPRATVFTGGFSF